MTVFVFILLFYLPSFGGETTVRFELQTLEGCQRMEKVVVKELRQSGIDKYSIVSCAPARKSP